MLDGDAQDADVLDADVLDAGAGLRAETLELWVEQGDHFCSSHKGFHVLPLSSQDSRRVRNHPGNPR